MAKKKTKKKTLKKQPKLRIAKTVTPQTVTKYRTKTILATDLALKARLAEKVMNVCQKWNGFEGTGVGTGESDGSAFGYTRAEEVFKKYAELCRQEGLWWRPISKDWQIGFRAVWVNATFELVDIETGFAVTFSGMGQGNNGVWAVNSAQTVALKQALLEMFMAYWTEPEDVKRQKVDYYDTFKEVKTPEDMRTILRQMNDLLDGKLTGHFNEAAKKGAKR